MPAFIIRFFSMMTACLLSADSKARAWLNSVCWFTSLSALAKDDAPLTQDADDEIVASWTQVWCSVGKLCHPGAYPSAPPANTQRHTGVIVRLRSHKRGELVFLSRISHLHQLMMCRHASGEADDAAFPFPVLLQSTMRPFAIVLFLLPEKAPLRSGYVYCLCRGLPYRGGPYLYGG